MQQNLPDNRSKSSRLFRYMRFCIFSRQVYWYIFNAILQFNRFAGGLCRHQCLTLCYRHFRSWYGNRLHGHWYLLFYVHYVPNHFALGIKDLKADTEFGSSLIIMSIVGGAVLPRVFGYISDATGNIQYGYIVPLICFIVVALFGFKGHRVKVKAEDLPVSAIL